MDDATQTTNTQGDAGACCRSRLSELAFAEPAAFQQVSMLRTPDPTPALTLPYRSSDDIHLASWFNRQPKEKPVVDRTAWIPFTGEHDALYLNSAATASAAATNTWRYARGLASEESRRFGSLWQGGTSGASTAIGAIIANAVIDNHRYENSPYGVFSKVGDLGMAASAMIPLPYQWKAPFAVAARIAPMIASHVIGRELDYLT